MRLKEFIIFIIIFTIIYFLFFFIYDYFMNKKFMKTREKESKSLIDLNKYNKFCSFYSVQPTANIETINSILELVKIPKYNDLAEIMNKYSLKLDETITIILYLEYIGLISKRKISTSNNCCMPLSINDESLILKYSLFFSNKESYDNIIKKVGLNSDKELNYMANNYLMPGVILYEKSLSYVGETYE